MKKVLMLLCACLIAINISAQPGTLDSTFGTFGIVTTSFLPDLSGCSSLAIQPDGKIVAAGSIDNGLHYDFTVIRYHSNGTPDSTFGTNGIVITAVGDSDALISSAKIQADGRIVVAGYGRTGNKINFAVVRYNSDGSPDNAFGTNGIVMTQMSPDEDHASSVLVQSDGKIVVTGYSSQYFLEIARYLSNGTLDNSFGTGGKVITNLSGVFTHASSAVLQTDGKIVVGCNKGGGTSPDFMVVRFNTDGSIDNTFGTAGIALTDFSGNGDFMRDIAIQPDGKIIAAGWTSTGGPDCTIATARYNSDGTPDLSFNGTGMIAPNPLGNPCLITSVIVQSNGRIVEAGIYYIGNDDYFWMHRYNSDGSIDSTFGIGGNVNFFSLYGVNDLALQSDGKIVSASANGCFKLERFKGDPVTGVGEYDSKPGLFIYPVPANDIINIVNRQADVKGIVSVFSVRGQLLLQQQIEQQKTTINISRFSAGLYFLTFRAGNSISVRTFIKE